MRCSHVLRHACLIVAATVLSVAAARAQPTTTSASSGSSIDFLTAYRFHLNATSLASGDDRFSWDTDFGGDLDLVDYGVGRINFVANYEAILGKELRAFDPNQGNYTLDGLASVRFGGLEAGAVFHHVSRHLSDRAKPQPIDWNMVGIQVGRHAAAGRWQLDARGRALSVLKRTAVDYSSQLDAVIDARLDVTERLALIAAGAVERFGAKKEIGGRSSETGARIEAGIRLTGPGAAIELFVGAERRVDPHPLDIGTRSWAVAGFRLRSR